MEERLAMKSCRCSVVLLCICIVSVGCGGDDKDINNDSNDERVIVLPTDPSTIPTVEPTPVSDADSDVDITPVPTVSPSTPAPTSLPTGNPSTPPPNNSVDLSRYSNFRFKYLPFSSIVEFVSYTGDVDEYPILFVHISNPQPSLYYDFIFSENRRWDDRVRIFAFDSQGLKLLSSDGFISDEPVVFDYERLVEENCIDRLPILLTEDSSLWNQRFEIVEGCEAIDSVAWGIIIEVNIQVNSSSGREYMRSQLMFTSGPESDASVHVSAFSSIENIGPSSITEMRGTKGEVFSSTYSEIANIERLSEPMR